MARTTKTRDRKNRIWPEYWEGSFQGMNFCCSYFSAHWPKFMIILPLKACTVSCFYYTQFSFIWTGSTESVSIQERKKTEQAGSIFHSKFLRDLVPWDVPWGRILHERLSVGNTAYYQTICLSWYFTHDIRLLKNPQACSRVSCSMLSNIMFHELLTIGNYTHSLFILWPLFNTNSYFVKRNFAIFNIS